MAFYDVNQINIITYSMSFRILKNSIKTITTIKQNIQSNIQIEPSVHELSNTKFISLNERKSYIFQTLAFFCNVLCIFLVIVFMELPSLLASQEEIQCLSEFIMFLSISSAIFNFFSCLTEKKAILVSKNEVFSSVSLWELFCTILTSAFMLVHPNTLIKQQKINNFLAVICYLRAIPIYFYLVKITKYYGYRPARILSFYGHKPKVTDILFAIKYIFKTNGLVLNAFLLFFTTVILSIISIASCSKYDMFDEIYNSIIAMTTVGYGEYSSETHLHRFITIITIIIGSIASSTLTVTFLESLKLECQEEKAYLRKRKNILVIKKLQKKEKINEKKIEILRNYINQIFVKNKRIDDVIVKSHEINETVSIESFMFFRKKLKILIEKEILTQSLLQFFLERRSNQNRSRSDKTVKTNKSKGRTQDNKLMYDLKKQILIS